MGIGETVAGAVIIAALSTLGDAIWAAWIPEHRAMFGLAHGMLLLMAIGLYLGTLARRATTGALGGGLTGLLCAAGFYALAPMMGYSAMFVLWCVLWVLLAFLNEKLRPGDGRALVRGLAAAAGSGIAFYLISGIWTSPPAGGPNYAWNFAAWTIAYLPGFAALLMGRAPRQR